MRISIAACGTWPVGTDLQLSATSPKKFRSRSTTQGIGVPEDSVRPIGAGKGGMRRKRPVCCRERHAVGRRGGIVVLRPVRDLVCLPRVPVSREG